MKVVSVAAAQQPIQFMELAALALPTDPTRLALIPNAATMQQEEPRSARRRAITQIEARDARRGRRDELSVTVGMFVRGVGPVGHQREMQIAFRARKMMDFEPFDQLLHALQRRQQRRHGDERTQVRGNAVPQFERRQQVAAKPRLTPRLTNATAASMAGMAPSMPSRPRTAVRPRPRRGRTTAQQAGLRRRQK